LPAAPAPDIGGGDGGDAGALAFVPNAYFAFRLTPEVHLGMGLFAAVRPQDRIRPDWIGRTQAIKSELKTINLNPSIAWKASDTLSLGAGLSMQYAEATLTNSAPARASPRSPARGRLRLGLQPGRCCGRRRRHPVGLAYRSEVDYTLEGDVEFRRVVRSRTARSRPTLPCRTALAEPVSQAEPEMGLLADVTWTGWSDFEELRIVRNGTSNNTTIENWEDICAIRWA
jgi:long-chain fatty acid transport protein